ncbi:MAG: hypothetical protein WCV86_01225 [Patescibacteria group bacterium]|jgi:hypothetical protein
MQNFSLKFIDVMVGVILGLGLQWWPALHGAWQYVAFIFAYLDTIDYWIDYGPSLKKFPPKREIDVFLDIFIIFSLFFYIYVTQLNSIAYFFVAFAVLSILDYLWLLSSQKEYKPKGTDATFVRSWMQINIVNALMALIGFFLAIIGAAAPIVLLVGFILLRIVTRIIPSMQYKKFHLSLRG